MDKQPAQAKNTLKIIVGALALSVVAHIFLAQQAVTRNLSIEGTHASLEHPFVVIFGVLALVAVALGMFVPDFMLRTARAQRGSAGLPIAATFVPTIVRFAFFEAVSIFGFIIAQTSRDMNFTYIASGAALAGFVMFFPTDDRIQQQISSGVRP